MPTVQRTKTYAVCPHCGDDAGCIDHLLGQAFKTIWYCDSCGCRYTLDFSIDGSVLIDKAEGRKITTLDVLVIKPQQKPVYFVVEGMRFDEPGMKTDDEGARFYYEEHSCPTNWFDPVHIRYEGDSDPHGLIEFVARKDESEFPPDEDFGPNDRDQAMDDFIDSYSLTETPTPD